MNFFYRFRSTRALLDDWNELENQEIYFSAPDQLNDPMEGFKDVFWLGDAIVWRNLFKHYLLCLIRMLSLFVIDGETYDPKWPENIVFSSNTNHPSPKFAELYRKTCANFFSSEEIKKIPEILGQFKHPVRREELKFYLRGVHGLALAAVTEEMRGHGLLPSVEIHRDSLEIAKRSLSSMTTLLHQNVSLLNDQERNSLNALFFAAEQVNRQIGIVQYFQATSKRQEIWLTAISQYPDLYVNSLDNLIFFDWYAACFVSAPNQAAMWGNYGDSHKGVCLKFSAANSESSIPSLKLRRIMGWGGGPNGATKHYGYVLHPFQRMRYVDRFVEVDFFRSIGRITMSALAADWYKDDDGKVSVCGAEVLAQEKEWMRAYNERFQLALTAKFLDWQHEDEYRLVLYSGLGGFEDPTDRKLKYDFEDLAGVIFGIKTPLEQKKRIVDIIRQKCAANNRSDFEFGQAYYSVSTGKIEIVNQQFFT